MNYKTLLVSLALLMPGLVLAQTASSYQCTFDDMQRRIVILTEPGVTVPCDVQYYKDTEMPGEVQTLWSATTEAGYCEMKAQEFVAKLEGWGWTCAAGAAEAAEPAVEPESAVEPEPAVEPDPPVDDTEALEPAD